MKTIKLMKNKITGELFALTGKPKVFIDGVAFEQVVKVYKKPVGESFDYKAMDRTVYKLRADSLERL